jgi:hypothetical protein
MRRAGKLVLLALLLGGLGCGGSRAGGDDADEARADEGDDDDDAPAPRSARAPKGPHVKGSGWRWKGQREACVYVHENECFAERKQACRAAGCGPSRCRDREDTAPIKVRCPGQ